MALNRNNYLRWKGTFTKRPYTITPVSTFFTFFASDDSVVIQPLSLSSASLGIDLTSLKIEQIRDASTGAVVQLSQDCDYDGAGNLTVYRPIPTLLGLVIYFTFKDNSGNQSPNIPTIPHLVPDFNTVIAISPVVTAWVAYPVSYVCVVDAFGNQSGYKAWTQLVLINSSSLAPIVPLTLKPNIATDPDYIQPVTDLITCPSDYVGSIGYTPLTISNFSDNPTDSNPNNFITIVSIFIYNATAGPGSTPVAINISGIKILKGQSRTYNIPAGIAWDITIGFTVNPGGNMLTCVPTRFWYTSINGVKADLGGSPNPVINTTPVGPNTETLGFPLGMTIFCQ
jgi:hypothetical protein